jgi:transposase InsO family protein
MRPLHAKSEAVAAFKTFKAMVENELGRKVREVMTDNAHKLSMGEMRTFCKTKGIRISTTVPYHPVSNGVTERMIGVLTGAVRAMLHDSGLPKSLWAEAFNTVTYVRNRVLTGALDGHMLYKMVYGVKPDVADLQCIWCSVCCG